MGRICVSPGTSTTPPGSWGNEYLEDVLLGFEKPVKLQGIIDKWNIIAVRRLEDGTTVKLTAKEKFYKAAGVDPLYTRIDVNFKAGENLETTITAVKLSGEKRRLELVLPPGGYNVGIFESRIPEAFVEVKKYLENPMIIENINRIISLVNEGDPRKLPANPKVVVSLLQSRNIKISPSLRVSAVNLAKKSYTIDDYTNMLVNQIELLSNVSNLRETLPHLVEQLRKAVEIVVSTPDEKLASIIAELDQSLRKRVNDALLIARRVRKNVTTGGNFIAYQLGGENLNYYEYPGILLHMLLGVAMTWPDVSRTKLKKRGKELYEEIKKELEEVTGNEALVDSILYQLERVLRSKNFFDNTLPAIIDLEIALSDEEFVSNLRKLDKNLRSSVLGALVNIATEEIQYGGRFHVYTVFSGKCLLDFIKDYLKLKQAVSFITKITAKDVEDSIRRVAEILEVKFETKITDNDTVTARVGETTIPIKISKLKMMLLSAALRMNLLDMVIIPGRFVTRETMDRQIMNIVTSILGITVREYNLGGKLSRVYVRVRDKGYKVLYPFKKDYGWRLDELGEELVKMGANPYKAGLAYEELYLIGQNYWGSSWNIKPPNELLGKLRKLENTSLAGVVDIIRFWKTPKTAIVKLLGGRYGLIVAGKGLILEAPGLDEFKEELAEAILTAPSHTLDLKRKKLLAKWLEKQDVKLELDPITEFMLKTEVELIRQQGSEMFFTPDGLIAATVRGGQASKLLENLLKNKTYSETGIDEFEVAVYELYYTSDGALRKRIARTVDLTRATTRDLKDEFKSSVIHKRTGRTYPSSLAKILKSLGRRGVKRILVPAENEGPIIVETDNLYIIALPTSTPLI